MLQIALLQMMACGNDQAANLAKGTQFAGGPGRSAQTWLSSPK
jgi:hypothetical protein